MRFKTFIVIACFGLAGGCNSAQPQEADAQRRNAEIVSRFLNEVVSGGRLELIHELWAEEMSWHLGDRHVHGLENYKRMMSETVGQAFVDMRLDVKDVIASGDKVVVRFVNSGKNEAPFMGFKPTGKRAAWEGIGIYRLDGGKIVEAWFSEDLLGMLTQLGHIQTPESQQEP